MAPDDFKFSRMEARLHEQQLAMAEQLAQLHGSDTNGVKHLHEAIDGLAHPREDPTMLALIGSSCGANGARSPLSPAEFKECASRPLTTVASQPQKYGACDVASSCKIETAGKQACNKLASDEKRTEFMKGPPEGCPASATIGNNKFVKPKLDKKSLVDQTPGAGFATGKGSIGDSERGDGSGSPTNNANGEPPTPCIIQRLARVIPCFGILLSLGASVFLGTAGMLVKLVESVHGIEVAVLRAVIQLVIYGSLIGIRRLRWTPCEGEGWPVAGRAILGGASITCSYYALKLIPLGDATTIRFSLPIWTLIMSYFFLRESCGLYKVVAVVISITGVVLVTKPDDCVYVLDWLVRAIFPKDTPPHLVTSKASHDIEEISILAETAVPFPTPPPLMMAPIGGFAALAGNLTSSPDDLWRNSTNDGAPAVVAHAYSDPLRQVEGCLMALASSICLSMSIIALRMCKQTPSEVSIFWLSTSSVVVGFMTLVALGQWAMPNNLRDCLFILLNGLCGALGQWFMTNALKVEQSGLIALARTADIEVAFLYSALLLGEQIRLTSIVGSILVSLGVITVLVPRWLGCGGAAADGDGADASAPPSQPSGRTSDDWLTEPGRKDQNAEVGSTSGVSSQSATTDEESGRGSGSQTETVTTIVNELTRDGRRSLTDARSIERIRKTLEARGHQKHVRTTQRTGADGGDTDSRGGGGGGPTA